MSPVEFDQAAEDGTRVRLKDRSQCFYEDEWYEADITAGLRMIHTHTGESHRVDPELLEQLTTAREAESGAVGGVKAVKMLDGIARMLGAEAACWIRDAASVWTGAKSLYDAARNFGQRNGRKRKRRPRPLEQAGANHDLAEVILTAAAAVEAVLEPGDLREKVKRAGPDDERFDSLAGAALLSADLLQSIEAGPGNGMYKHFWYKGPHTGRIAEALDLAEEGKIEEAAERLKIWMTAEQAAALAVLGYQCRMRRIDRRNGLDRRIRWASESAADREAARRRIAEDREHIAPGIQEVGLKFINPGLHEIEPTGRTAMRMSNE